jgi:hypothetical protein
MEENDLLENKFRSSFSDFGKEPPERVWENIRSKMHPEQDTAGFWSRFCAFFRLNELSPGVYVALGGVVVLLFLVAVYLISDDYQTIRGHAYAGESRLNRGTAILFRVVDKAIPWDSAAHYRSAIIGTNGLYQFRKVEPGKYLLRIAPEANSDDAEKFQPSWFDQHETPDSCHLIIVNNGDVNADVHLIANGRR